MSDYTKVFDGASKDAAESTVLGADHDTEFNAIATAISSKADKVVAATSGNIAELDADGNLVDSGIASADLDGLTSNAQTQLTTIAPSTEITNHQAAGFHQVHNGSATLSSYSISTNVTEDTWETFGPTGATNALGAMDAWPSSARIGIFYIYAGGQTTGTSAMTIEVFGAQGTITPVDDADSNRLVWAYWNPALDNSQYGVGQQVLIPLDAALEFQIWWDIINGDTADVHIIPIGFIDGAV